MADEAGKPPKKPRTARIPITEADRSIEAMSNEELQRSMKAVVEAAEEAAKGPLAEIGRALKESADKLRIPISQADLPRFEPGIFVGPPPEIVATNRVREEVARLREVSAATSDQIRALVVIASELKPALEDYTRHVRRSNTILLVLTVVLVVLTGVLVFRAF